MQFTVWRELSTLIMPISEFKSASNSAKRCLSYCWAMPACSEQKLRRLEIAATNPQLRRIPLWKLLNLSESRWQKDAAAAGTDISKPVPAAAAAHPSSQAVATEKRSAELGSTISQGNARVVNQVTGAGEKPKRPRGGRREKERLARIERRKQQAAAAGADNATAASATGTGDAASSRQTQHFGSDEHYADWRSAHRPQAAAASTAGSSTQAAAAAAAATTAAAAAAAAIAGRPAAHPAGADASSSAPVGVNDVAGDDNVKPKRPRGGKREKERLARIAARRHAAESGEQQQQQHANGRSEHAAVSAAEYYNVGMERGNGAERPSMPRGGRRDVREPRPSSTPAVARGGGSADHGAAATANARRNAGSSHPVSHVTAVGVDEFGAGFAHSSAAKSTDFAAAYTTATPANVVAGGDTARGADVSDAGGEGVDKPKRPRGGRREREKQERRAAKLAAATAEAALAL